MTSEELTSAIAILVPNADCAISAGQIVRWSGPGEQPTETQLLAALAAIEAGKTNQASRRSRIAELRAKSDTVNLSMNELQEAVKLLLHQHS